VLDGGNLFDVYSVARGLHGKTNWLERIRIARAFTCHQITALLAGQPAGSQPRVILDLLSTFYDENVPQLERTHLLENCLTHLQRLSRSAPLIVCEDPGPADLLDDGPLSLLERLAERIWRFELPPSYPQLRLF